MEAAQNDVETVRAQIRTVLRDVNGLVTDVERNGLPDGTHALASALRQRLDDLVVAIDRVLDPSGNPARRSPSTADHQPPAVDEGTLNSLIDDLGDASRVASLVQLFLTELHGRRNALSAAAAAGDIVAAKSVAHTLKSSALLLGAAGLGRACDQLSSIESLDQLGSMVADVLRHATAAARWFQIWLSNQPVTP